MNPVDIAVVFVLLASGVFALMRGFVYEVLAMAGWIAASLGALWGLAPIRPFVHRYIASQTLADIAGGLGIFLAILLASSFITHAIARRVRKSAISPVDRSLGFAFGLVRGLVLASLCFMVVTKLMAPDEPDLLSQAKTRPLMVFGARVLQTLLPSQFADVDEKAREASESLRDLQQTKDVYDRLSAPRPKSADPRPGEKTPGYDNRSLERLIETTTGK
ncbi:MAG TPA: CvpA family protein [Rhodospirillaceae bacterium]|nr:CvpA family protein [Rhodospirillaceae bacterium]